MFRQLPESPDQDRIRKILEKELAGNPFRLCQFYYYIGLNLRKGNKAKAKEYFEHCLKQQVKNPRTGKVKETVEQVLAREELKGMEKK
jgi:hypothetical protein